MRHGNLGAAVGALAVLSVCLAVACGDGKGDPAPDPGGGGGSPPGGGGGGGGGGGTNPPGGGGGGGSAPPGGGAGGGGGDGGGGDGGDVDGGGGAAPPPSGGGSGSTTFVRKLGGAGDEVSEAGGLATAADGSVVALSAIGDVAQLPAELGITRIDGSGRTRWAQAYSTGGDEWDVAGVAVTPEVGNVFFALRRHVPSIEHSLLTKFGPTGDFDWNRAIEGVVTGLSVDGSGSALVGWLRRDRPVVSKYRWNGELVWEVSPEWPVGPGGTEVAFDRFGDAVAAFGLSVLKYGADGLPLWDVTLDAPGGSVEHVGTTAAGTVVVGGWYSERLTFAGRTIRPEGGTRGFFLAALERDGRPRWLRARARPGPFAVDPEGRIAVVEKDLARGCDAIARWDLTGKVLWRRTLARCDADGAGRALAANVAVAPDHGIWVQGDARVPFDVGTGVLTPSGWDWFLVRLAP